MTIRTAAPLDISLRAHQAHLHAERLCELVEVIHDAEGTTNPTLEDRGHAALTLLLSESVALKAQLQELMR